MYHNEDIDWCMIAFITIGSISRDIHMASCVWKKLYVDIYAASASLAFGYWLSNLITHFVTIRGDGISQRPN
ncbi:hypothetical protein T265_15917, partial [Opisthorchis viverrini]